MILLHAVMARGSVSARAFDLITRVARTIADLVGSADIGPRSRRRSAAPPLSRRLDARSTIEVTAGPPNRGKRVARGSRSYVRRRRSENERIPLERRAFFSGGADR